MNTLTVPIVQSDVSLTEVHHLLPSMFYNGPTCESGVLIEGNGSRTICSQIPNHPGPWHVSAGVTAATRFAFITSDPKDYYAESLGDLIYRGNAHFEARVNGDAECTSARPGDPTPCLACLVEEATGLPGSERPLLATYDSMSVGVKV